MDGLSHWWLRFDDGRVVIDGFSGSDGAVLFPDVDPPDMEALPADAWLASEVPDLDHTVEALARMLEAGWDRAGAVSELTSPLLQTLDGARLAMGGTSIPGSWVQLDAVVDGDRSARRRMRETLAKAPRWGLAVTETDGTWSVDAGTLLGSITMTVDGSLRIRRGDPASARLETTERYIEAKAWLDGIEPRLYADLPRMNHAAGLVIDAFLPPVVSRLSQDIGRVIVGVGDGGELTSRIVIELIQPRGEQ